MNRQTEREYRDALDGLRFSKEGKERMMKNLMEQAGQGRAKRRGARPLRAGLAAACLCLALVGTACAAVWAFGRVEVVNEVHEPFRAGYSVMGDVGRFSMGQFSQTLQEDAAAGNHFASMKDWQSVKNYVGLPLMDSRLLMEDSEHGQILVNGDPFGVFMMGLEDGMARALEDGEQPQVVRVLTESVVDNWVVSVTVFAATEYADLEQGLPGLSVEHRQDYSGPTAHSFTSGDYVEQGLPGLGVEYPQDYNGPTAHSFTSEDYRMACGETASIVYDGYFDFDIAFFTHDGLLYQVRALGVEDGEAEYPTGEEVLLKALDSFV